MSHSGHIGKVPVILSKPQTFMNVSGESVSSLSRKIYCLLVVKLLYVFSIPGIDDKILIILFEGWSFGFVL